MTGVMIHKDILFLRPFIQQVELADEWASSPLLSEPDLPVIHYTPQYLYSPTVPFDMKVFYPQDADSQTSESVASLVKAAGSAALTAETLSPKQSAKHSTSRTDMKFIVMLRNPTARAFSSYWFKNSHLFQPNGRDGGSIGARPHANFHRYLTLTHSNSVLFTKFYTEEFSELVRREIQARTTYDKCMQQASTKMKTNSNLTPTHSYPTLPSL